MRQQILTWVPVSEGGLPPCDRETVFVGRNSAGYVGCFNHMRYDNCIYCTAEGDSIVMSDLVEWARISP